MSAEVNSFNMGIEPNRRHTKKKNRVLTPHVKPPLENTLSPYFTESNPLYVKKILRQYEAAPTEFDPTNRTCPKQIKMLLCRKIDDTDIYSVTLRSICYFKGTYTQWQIYLQERSIAAHSFKTTSSFKFKNPSTACSPFDTRIAAAAHHIFWWNQRYRWMLKRVIGRWIKRKAAKRIIGTDSDIVTMDPIPIHDQIQIVCTASRTTYVFSGSTLLKTVISNLETQIEAIPRPRPPINPYTNLPFTYGQMIEVYHRLVLWCGQTRRTVPAILCLYKDANFNPSLMYRINHNFIQYTAGSNHFLRDESDNDYFLENLIEMIHMYRDSRTVQNEERRMFINFEKRFVNWITRETNVHLIKLWRQLVTDYWYFKQTQILPRVYWVSEETIMKDVHQLLHVSRPDIMYIKKKI